MTNNLLVVLNNGWQKVNSASAAILWLCGGDHSRMDHPSSTTTHLQPRSALETWRNRASWWIHGAMIRLAQSKHTWGTVSHVILSRSPFMKASLPLWVSGRVSVTDTLSSCLPVSCFICRCLRAMLHLFPWFSCDSGLVHPKKQTNT